MKRGRDDGQTRRGDGEAARRGRSPSPFASSPLRFLVASVPLLLLLAGPAFAQPDTTAVPPVPLAADTTGAEARTTESQPVAREVVPGAALRRSLVVPGWGQVYNRDYVRAVIAAAAVGGLVTLAVVNNSRTVRYRRAAIYEDCLNRPTTVPPGTCDGYTQFEDEWIAAGQPPASVSRALRDASRRNRDFSILLSALAYALQALDAYVSAHLAGFDVSEDLSVHVAPTPTGATAALRWTF